MKINTERRKQLFREIPVYPQEILITELGRRMGMDSTQIYGLLFQLPIDCPLAEDDQYICFPSRKDKKRAFASVRSIVEKDKHRGAKKLCRDAAGTAII